MLRRLLLAVLTVPLMLFLGSLLGMYHPLGDSLAVFGLQLTVTALISGICFWLLSHRKTAVLICLLAGGWMANLGSYFLPVASMSKSDYSAYQKNLSFRNRDLAPLANDIRNLLPDFVTLQEVTDRNKTILHQLDDHYSSQHYCDFATVGGVAVISRWPAVTGSRFCAEKNGMAAMQVETPDGRVWIVSLHLHWPYPYRQAGQVRQLLPRLETLRGRKIIGGDFNMVPWSSVLHQFRAASGSRRIGRVHKSFPMFDGWLRLPIDHILVPDTALSEAELRPRLGSDHHGLLARFQL
ncbi:MAG: endonuclease [Rhodobacteraceae bacterium]|nr:endonuclease [Paracoccaceae bacterium]